MATLDSIADEIGYTRNELMQSMVKFGLTNRDWRNEGLTAHKRLPRYQENPMATKPPSAAQLAARKRFAEMARNGSLNRKRQIAAKQKAGVKRKANPTSDIKWELYLYGPSKGEIATVDGAQVLIFPIKKSETDEYDMPEWARAVVEIFPSATHDEAHYPVGSVQNGKDNVRRLVAQAKIKRNPAGLYDNINAKRARIAAGSGERMRRPGSKGAPTDAAFKRSAMTARKSNPAKVKYRDKSKDMAANHVAGYAVHKADRPYYLATAWFTNKSDAMEVAQEVADRTGIQYAVTKAVTYFGPK